MDSVDDSRSGPAHDRAAALRREVGRFRASEQRRRFPACLHLGTLGAARLSVTLPGGRAQLDPGLAFDLVDATLDGEVRQPGGGDPLGPGAGACDAWLTRPGIPTLHDLDPVWMAAAEGALRARGGHLRCFYAVTRTGWLDVRSGDSRAWKRLRLDR